MNVGTRLFYDKKDGEILVSLGEMSGDVLPRKEIDSVGIIDIPFGLIDQTTHKVIGVDVVSGEIITEEIAPIETEEQKRIRELEDALLLQTENEIGGIL